MKKKPLSLYIIIPISIAIGILIGAYGYQVRHVPSCFTEIKGYAVNYTYSVVFTNDTVFIRSVIVSDDQYPFILSNTSLIDKNISEYRFTFKVVNDSEKKCL